MGGVWTREINSTGTLPESTQTVEISPVQTGNWTPSTETFTSPGSVILLKSSPDTYGFMTFDLYNLDSANNPTGPRGIELDNILIAFKHSVGGAPSEVVRFFIVPEARPELYSETNTPFSRGEGIFTTTPGFVGRHTYSSTGDFDLQTALIGLGSGDPVKQNNFRTIVEDPLWNGRICISIDQASASGTSFIDLGISLFFNTWPTHTGTHGNTHKRSRAVHGYKSGMPASSDEFLRDGYLEGTTVHMDEWDPADPGPTYTPPSGEGLVTDDIIDIEN